MGLGFGMSPLEIMATDAMLRGAVYLEDFTYSIAYLTGTATALGASSSVDASVQLNNDADFIIQEVNLVSWSAVATIIGDPDYTLLLTMAGSGRQIMNQAQHVLTFCGAFAQNRVPGRRPFPRLLAKSNTIQTTLTNRSAVAANRVDLAFRGFKVFYQGNPDMERQRIFHVL